MVNTLLLFFKTYQSMDHISLLLFLAFACLCLTAIRQRKSRLPPGPFPLPVVGNLFKLGAEPHKSLTKLASVYGPLMSLKLRCMTTVVASSPKMAEEILRTNDQAFSSRTVPNSLHACDHHKHSMVWLPVSAKWRNLRRFCTTQLFITRQLDSNQGLRRQKVDELLAFIEEKSNKKQAVDIGQLVFSTVLNLMSNTVFSRDLTHLDSNYAQQFKATVKGLSEESMKPNLADYFPVLRSLDLQGIRRNIERGFGKLDELFDGLVKQRLESKELGTSSPSDFLDTILDYKQEDGFQLSDLDIKALLKDIFLGAIDTSSAAMEWIMAELLRNPDKLAKAKLELEERIGKDKAVDESDADNLPYLQAVVKETFRLHPPFPFLVPHKAESNVEICDFIVPKNTQVIINLWTIGRDTNIWESPTSFMPERFLNTDMDFRGRDFRFIPFGAGRRICPGIPLALRIVHFMLASLLHTFNWKLEEGMKPEDLDMEDKFGLTLEKATPLKAIPIKI